MEIKILELRNETMDRNIDVLFNEGNEVIEKKWHMVFKLKRIFLLLLIPISLFILWICKNNSDIAEYIFARGVIRWITQAISLVVGIIPYSLMELEIIAVPIILVIFLARFIIKIISKIRNNKKELDYVILKEVMNAACTISILLFIYVIFAGVNYYRYPFSAISDLTIEDSSVEDLYYLNLSLANKAADLREKLHLNDGTEDEFGVLQLDTMNWKELSNTAANAFDKLSLVYPVFKGNYGAPKPVLFSKFMSRMEITGIFWPFSLEANVNVEAAPYSIPATMSHELAHLHGFMREDEANFIAYLACLQSENLEFQYSGVMLALTYASNQLYKESPELYRKVQLNYNEGMFADLRDEYFYWKQFEDTVISAVSTTMNDNYLKANNQSDGVKSYGRMVDLLLAEYKKTQNNVN